MCREILFKDNCKGKGKSHPNILKKDVQKIAWNSAQVVRNEEGLRKALQELEQCKTRPEQSSRRGEALVVV